VDAAEVIAPDVGDGVRHDRAQVARPAGSVVAPVKGEGEVGGHPAARRVGHDRSFPVVSAVVRLSSTWPQPVSMPAM
jgi:hypothetical protein